MQNPLVIGMVVFGVILVGAFVGWAIKGCSVSMAVVATFSALVLGLLISNANSSIKR
jgi:uncharacterized membrane protein